MKLRLEKSDDDKWRFGWYGRTHIHNSEKMWNWTEYSNEGEARRDYEKEVREQKRIRRFYMDQAARKWSEVEKYE